MAKASGFTRWLRTTLALLALVGGGVLALVVIHGKGADLEGLFAQLPAETGNLVVAQRLDTLLQALNRLAAQPSAPPEIKKLADDLRAQTRAQVAFDATQPAEWERAGFHLGGAWAVATRTDAPDLSFAYLPVSDASAARTTLRDSLGKLGATLGPADAQGISPIAWSAPPTPDASTPRALAEHGGYLVLALARTPAVDAVGTLAKQLAGHGLASQPEFARVRSALGEPWNVFGYVSPAQVKQGLAAPDAHAEKLEPYARGGIGFSLHIGDDRITARLRIFGDPAAASWPALAARPPADHLGVAPLLIARSSVDPQKLVAFVEQSGHPERLEKLRADVRSIGLDLDKDLLPLLDGQSVLAVLPPAPGDKLPANAALLVGVKDAAKARALLPRVASPTGGRLVPDPSGWYPLPFSTLGVTDDALVVIAGEHRLPDAARAMAERKGESMAEHLPQPVRDAYRSGPAFYVYADLEGAAELLAHGPIPGAAQSARVLRSLQGASLGVDDKDGVVQVDGDLWPPPGGFGRAILASDGGAP